MKYSVEPAPLATTLIPMVVEEIFEAECFRSYRIIYIHETVDLTAVLNFGEPQVQSGQKPG